MASADQHGTLGSIRAAAVVTNHGDSVGELVPGHVGVGTLRQVVLQADRSLRLGCELAVCTVVLLSRSFEVELDSAAKHPAIRRLTRSRQATSDHHMELSTVGVKP